MTTDDFNTALDHLIKGFHSFVPNDKADQAFTLALHELQKDFPGKHIKIFAYLLGLYHDGVVHGNWHGLSIDECIELNRKLRD